MNILKKHKTKIIVCAIVLITLICTFFMGDDRTSDATKETDISRSETSALNSDEEISAYEEALETALPKQTDEPDKTEELRDEDKQKTDENSDETKQPYKETTKKEEKDAGLTCTVSVRCDTILNNMAVLSPEKREIIPTDGVILSERTVSFNDGESAFDVLKREMINNNIHLEFVNTPIYDSAYIEGIANIYEFDCGELSGWMYKVNGDFPKFGSSSYKLKNGDKLEWIYTCDFGKDVGGEYIQRN